MDKKSELLNVQEAAKFLKVNPGTIRRWAHNKQIKGMKVGIRGDWRFSQQELLKMARTTAEVSSVNEIHPQKNEDFLKNVSNAVPALVAVYSIRTGVYVYVNGASKKILGYSSQEILDGGLTLTTSLVHPDDLPRIMEENEKALKFANSKQHTSDTEPIANFEYRMKHKDGRWIWLHTDGSVYSRGKDGKVEYVLNVSVDITRRREAEAETKRFAVENKNYSQTLTKHIADAVIVTDKQFIVQSWNKGAEKIYGWKAAEIIGKPITSLETMFVSDSREASYKLLQKQGYWHGEVTQKRKDGTSVPILSSVAYVLNDNGEQIGVIAINRDITKRKNQEKRKDDFIALVSHELKTPVTSLKIFTQILEKRFQNKGDLESMSYFTKMDRQLTKLNELVNGLLEIPRIQEGKLRYSTELFDMDVLIQETIENVQRVTKSHKIFFKKREGGKLFADKNRIEQVLINLINNAIKYSPKAKKIIINASSNDENVMVSVTDYGVGVPPEKKKKIFERFYQVQNEEANTYPGLGVGLYISKEIIEWHKGKIWVESEKEKGSTFYFTVPFKREVL